MQLSPQATGWQACRVIDCYRPGNSEKKKKNEEEDDAAKRFLFTFPRITSTNVLVRNARGPVKQTDCLRQLCLPSAFSCPVHVKENFGYSGDIVARRRAEPVAGRSEASCVQLARAAQKQAVCPLKSLLGKARWRANTTSRVQVRRLSNVHQLTAEYTCSTCCRGNSWLLVTDGGPGRGDGGHGPRHKCPPAKMCKKMTNVWDSWGLISFYLLMTNDKFYLVSFYCSTMRSGKLRWTLYIITYDGDFILVGHDVLIQSTD